MLFVQTLGSKIAKYTNGKTIGYTITLDNGKSVKSIIIIHTIPAATLRYRFVINTTLLSKAIFMFFFYCSFT